MDPLRCATTPKMDEQIWGLDPGSAHIVFHEYYRFKPFLNTPKKPKALPCYTPLDMHGLGIFTYLQIQITWASPEELAILQGVAGRRTLDVGMGMGCVKARKGRGQRL